jgi:hypothetical protein
VAGAVCLLGVKAVTKLWRLAKPAAS